MGPIAEIASDDASNIFGKRNAQIRGLRLRPPLQLRIHGNLRAYRHGAIMPSGVATAGLWRSRAVSISFSERVDVYLVRATAPALARPAWVASLSVIISSGLNR
jgi:hypothetical protein